MPRDFRSFKSYRPRTYQRRQQLVQGYQAARAARSSSYRAAPQVIVAAPAGEMKYFDTERSVTAIPASTDWTATEFPPNVGTPTTLVVPTVGSAINQRIGREIKLHKLKIRGNIVMDPQTGQSAGDASAQIRVLVVQDMQTNGAQAQGEQIMTDPTAADAKNAISAFQSLDNLGRFRVWKDKTYVIQNPNMANDTGATGGVVQQGLIKPIKFMLNFKNPIPVRFNGTNGGTIADIVDNSFCVYATCTNAALVPRLTYNARACYKE